MEILEKLIMAKCPLIQIVTHEERRAIEYVREVARRLSLPKTAEAEPRMVGIKLWSVSKGLYGVNEDKVEQVDAIGFVFEAIKHVGDALFVGFDFHPFMHDEKETIRALREATFALRNSKNLKTIILIQPVKSVPVELEKDMQVIELPMPTREVLTDRITTIAKRLNAKNKLSDDDIDKIVRSGLGLTRDEFDTALAMCRVEFSTIDGRAATEVAKQKREIVKKSGLLEYVDTMVSISDVGGLDNLKHWLERRQRAFSQQAIDFGLSTPKGVILAGISGCGKSLTAKAIANMLELPLLRLDIGSLMNQYVGQSEANVSAAIRVVEAASPAVLFIDEMEKALAGGGSGQESHGTTTRIRGKLLTWLQERTSHVFVVGTVNNISALPPELLRKGRFDEIFFVDLPIHDERESIFRIHIKKRNRDVSQFNVNILARLTDGFNGAEIEQAIESAMYEAYFHGRDLIEQDVIDAINCTVPLSKTMKEEIDMLRRWAKSGRAVMANREIKQPIVERETPDTFNIYDA